MTWHQRSAGECEGRPPEPSICAPSWVCKNCCSLGASNSDCATQKHRIPKCPTDRHLLAQGRSPQEILQETFRTDCVRIRGVADPYDPVLMRSARTLPFHIATLADGLFDGSNDVLHSVVTLASGRQHWPHVFILLLLHRAKNMIIGGERHLHRLLLVVNQQPKSSLISSSRSTKTREPIAVDVASTLLDTTTAVV